MTMEIDDLLQKNITKETPEFSATCKNNYWSQDLQQIQAFSKKK